jgi:hypothetical protein
MNEIRHETQAQKDILSELDNFTGTSQYFKASPLYHLNLTEGIQFFRNKLNCYWLIDIVGSVLNEEKIKENLNFIVWKIKVNENKSFIVRAYKDYSIKETEEENKKYLLYEQKGEYTDFLLNDFEFYQINEVLLLKSEY